MKNLEITCPHCNTAFTVELPEKPKKPRGQLFGLTIEEMSDDQLKREIINAGSVLYKAKQRGAAEDVIAANQARLDAAKAEKAKRHPEVVVAENVEAAIADSDESIAAEV